MNAEDTNHLSSSSETNSEAGEAVSTDTRESAVDTSIVTTEVLAQNNSSHKPATTSRSKTRSRGRPERWLPSMDRSSTSARSTGAAEAAKLDPKPWKGWLPSDDEPKARSRKVTPAQPKKEA